MLEEKDYLELLKTDLRSGKFSEILDFYRNNPDDLLLSGRKDSGPVFYMRQVHKRRPLDTNPEVQSAFDMAASEYGFKALRSNSIFCTGDASTARGYGKIYVVFPKNGFDILWSPKIEDLYVLLDMYEAFSENYAEEKLKVDEFEIIMPDGKEKIYYSRFGESEDAPYEALLDLARIGIVDHDVVHEYDRMGDLVRDHQDTFDFSREDNKENFKVFQKWLNRYAMDEKQIKNIPKKFLMYNFFMQTIPENYRDEDLRAAIRSGNEIMVRADGYIFVDLDFFNKYRDNIL